VRRLQSEKLASIGMLAAGVAHEINNPASFVLANLEALAELLQSSDGKLKADPKAPRKLGSGDILFRSHEHRAGVERGHGPHPSHRA